MKATLPLFSEERLCDGCMTPADFPADGETEGGASGGAAGTKTGACITCGDPGGVKRRKSGAQGVLSTAAACRVA